MPGLHVPKEVFIPSSEVWFWQLTLVIYIKNYFGLDSSHGSAFFSELFLLKQKSVRMACVSSRR